MDFFVFISEQWLLVSLLVALIYALAITERIKAGKPASAHEATLLINTQDARVVDLRDRSEFAAGHIVDAIHIPHGEIEKRIGELAPYKEKTLILADKIGQHAGPVGRQLKKAGYTVRRLEGGMSEWSNQKLPLVKG
ncbi:rhodanese-like domain-containing protein [Microbulbifer hydrolyticus]|uniref:Rhodanese-like domain-containing protein n=1 Tax=Microbulbifer hydrolyticus TaxID=48074 RepID=A0A6P1T7N7_9GAMM|nr:rhodanese-like domain-containing protein [Microbulbifer hydrolyticus]MBB5211446.1 rhodanese-related sulfurtransferase [Microbulbifer hydrolyticus]QHQ37801.1 rhodanese-like domain-containing protein [Microbulbifer hydrolyticus]